MSCACMLGDFGTACHVYYDDLNFSFYIHLLEQKAAGISNLIFYANVVHVK